MIASFALLLVAKPDSQSILDHAIELIGGEPTVRQVSALAIKGLSTIGINEQVERYTGPILTNVADFEARCELSSSKFISKFSLRGAQVPEWTPMTVSADFGSNLPVRPSLTMSPMDMRDQLLFNPARILLYAKNTSPCERLEPINEDGNAYDRVCFAINGTKAILWFRKVPGNLDRIEFVGPRDNFWSAWREVRSVWQFGAWQSLPNGMAFPFYMEETRNGVRFSEWNITDVKVETSGPASDAGLTREIKRLDLRPSSPNPPLPPLKKVTDGLWQYPGIFPCEVAESEQDLLVIDAPYSLKFCEGIFKDLRTRFPAKRISGVVLTDPYWPHQAGFLAYAKQGIPIYTDVRNLALFRDMHKNWGIKERLRITGVSGVTKVNPAWELFSLDGMASERFLNVFFPRSKVLFCSDTLVWKSKSELYSPLAAQDVARLVDREKLSVESVVSTHAPLTPWKTVLTALGR